MCGILLHYSKDNKILSNNFIEALNSMTHRGPDSFGTAEFENLTLGHRRLSIVDLSDKSNQPFKYKNLSLIFNGEIFNFIELSQELKKLGHKFLTSSDTEIVLHAYNEWGTKCFEKFNGMWALAIFDENTEELLISRDRFGMKPLFLFKTHKELIVSSEIEPITILKKELTRNYSEILAFVREGTHETFGSTFFCEIEEVQPASLIKFIGADIKEKKLFWSYPKANDKQTCSDTLLKFNELLKDAVSIRMRSDVPVASLLSGGVDSTIISALATENDKKNLLKMAFCYSSEDEKDEKYFAQIVADKLKLKLNVRNHSSIDNDYLFRLTNLVKRLGKGHSSPAIVTVSNLYEEVQTQGIKVALDGQGADELLGGYKNYFLTLMPYYLKRLDFKNFFRTFFDQLNFGFGWSILLWLRVVLPPNLKKIGRVVYGYEKYLQEPRNSKTKHHLWIENPVSHTDKFNKYLIEQHKIGLTNLLYYGDIISMHHSVENRSPFMDHRLVEFSFSTDGYFKVNGNQDKYALRQNEVYTKFKDVLERKKIGFASPISSQIKIKMLSELSKSKILLYPIFNASLEYELTSGKFHSKKWERFLFRLYQIHLWEKIYFNDGVS